MRHIVNFSEYCYKCTYRDKTEHQKPCCECISIPAREDSRRPEKYLEDPSWKPSDKFMAAYNKWQKENLNVKEKNND